MLKRVLKFFKGGPEYTEADKERVEIKRISWEGGINPVQKEEIFYFKADHLTDGDYKLLKDTSARVKLAVSSRGLVLLVFPYNEQ